MYKYAETCSLSTWYEMLYRSPGDSEPNAWFSFKAALCRRIPLRACVDVAPCCGKQRLLRLVFLHLCTFTFTCCVKVLPALHLLL